jgi:two-component system, chemotaxis family, protein-glutamate methylesterase/glutaminase
MAFELVVMGASWGGLVALEQVLESLPDDFELPIAVAQHRSIESAPGSLSGVLARHSRRPVREISDKDDIVSGHVYLAPADYHVLVEPGSFALSIDAAVKYSRPSIDILFDTAADAYGDRLIAVVLTGANEDGAHGIERVKRRGGVTIAQDPATAERGEMPAAAIATGAVEHVVALDGVGSLLRELAGRPPERLSASAGGVNR